MTKTDLNIRISDRLDRGLAYGEACFETFRVIDGQVFGWPQHLSRLCKGLESFGISLSERDLELIRKQTFERAAEIADDALVRITVSGGVAEWGLLRSGDQQPEIYIQCMPYVAPYRKMALSAVEWPFAVQVRSAKFSSDYALTLRAMRQWRSEGLPGRVTPLICKNGRLLSTPTSNVLICRRGVWHTPDESHGGVLAGVIRNTLVTESVAEISDCSVVWLDDCEAIALTNSGFFIQPVSMVCGRRLNTEHQVFEKLCQVLRGKRGVPAL